MPSSSPQLHAGIAPRKLSSILGAQDTKGQRRGIRLGKIGAPDLQDWCGGTCSVPKGKTLTSRALKNAPSALTL